MAVVGAGIAGLTAARALLDEGLEVRVFDKARGVGGRTSTRRQEPLEFDHGAQYFTVRDERFASAVARWRETSIVAPWEGRIVSLENGRERPSTPHARYVGVPGMNAVAKHLAAGLDVTLETRVLRLSREGDGWRLVQDSGKRLGTFDTLILAQPAAQAAELLNGASPLAVQARGCVFTPCWAVMLGFERPLATTFDAAFVHDSPLSWIARNSSKPDRPARECWVLHAGQEWSAANLDTPVETVRAVMLEEFRRLVADEVTPLIHTDAHRWRYAQPEEPLQAGALWDPAARVAVCGDWCQGARVEGAYLSGLSAAEHVRQAR